MGRARIRLSMNQKTGKKDIWIDLESDADLLPIEHEQQHREILTQLLGKGVLHPDELGQVHVQRGASAGSSAGVNASKSTEEGEQSGASQGA